MKKGKTYAERYNVSTDENGVLQNVRLRFKKSSCAFWAVLFMASLSL